MNKVFILFALSMIILSTSVLASDTYQVTVRPKIAGDIQPSTTFYYEFLFTQDNSCAVIYKNATASITTDQYGIGYSELDVSGITGTPNYLCEYRDYSLRKVHNISIGFFENVISDGFLYSSNNEVYVSETGNKGFVWGDPISPYQTAKMYYDSVLQLIGFTHKISAPYFIGDGSLLTNITADGLDINDDEMLYFNKLDTVGIRYNSSGGAPNYLEVVNASLLVPNMISSNSVDAELGYFNYLQMGWKGGSTGNPFTVLNSTGTEKIRMTFSGDLDFLDTEDNQYITWDTDETSAGIGLWNYPTYKSLELWSGSEPDDTIELYNPTNVWGNLSIVNGNVSADYFIGDGSLLINLPIGTTYNSTYDATSQDVTANRTSWASIYNATYDAKITSWANVTTTSCSVGQTVTAINNVTGAVTCSPSYTFNTTYDASQSFWNRTGTTLHVKTSGDSVGLEQDRYLFFNYPTSTKSLHYNSTNTRFEFNDRLYSPNINTQTTSANGIGTLAQTDLKGGTSIVGSVTGNTTIGSNGKQIMYGTARVNKTLSYYSYNIGGVSGTYNGVTCSASGLGSLNGMYFKTYDDGSGVGQCESSNIQMLLPADYVAGTDLTVNFCYLSGGTTGNVVWGTGIARVPLGANYNTATYSWASEQTLAVPTVAWQKDVANFTISGASFQPKDTISVIVYRNADAGGDTYAGDSYTCLIGVTYLSDRIGE